MSPEPGSITALLDRLRAGEAPARGELLRRLALHMHPIACRLMGVEPAGHTLQPTALVNEAVARLLTQEAIAAAPTRAYLFAAAARTMRQVLVDHARAEGADKRGGDWVRVPLTEGGVPAEERGYGLVEISEAIDALSTVFPRAADVVTLRYFAGHTVSEVSAELGLSESTVEADWRLARAWLLRALVGDQKIPPDQGPDPKNPH
jgi:RNA polymerase sigma factor (TIGR02999 family)